MPFPLIAAGIAAAGSLAGGIIGNRAAARENQKQRAATMQLAKYQYQTDLDMWNRANAYNSPEEQMKRLQAAGLNPNMVYGSGSAAGNTSAQLPKFNAPNLQFGLPNPAEGLPAAIAMFQDFQIKQQQVDNLKAQEEAIKTKTAFEEYVRPYRAGILGGQAEYQDDILKQKLKSLKQDFDIKGELFPSQLSFMQGKNRAQTIEAEKNLALTTKIRQDTDLQKLKTDWFVTSLIGRFGLDVAKTIIGATGVGKLGKLIPGKSLNQNKRTVPRYNSTQSWKDMGY